MEIGGEQRRESHHWKLFEGFPWQFDSAESAEERKILFKIMKFARKKPPKSARRWIIVVTIRFESMKNVTFYATAYWTAFGVLWADCDLRRHFSDPCRFRSFIFDFWNPSKPSIWKLLVRPICKVIFRILIQPIDLSQTLSLKRCSSKILIE